MRDSFKKLLESVQATCPEVITEEVVGDMMNQFESGIADLTASATEEGKLLGFREGYDEGKRVGEEQAKAKFDELVAKLDEEATEKLTGILEMLDENHTAKLQELYDYMKANMIAKTEMDAALAAQDADYAEKLQCVFDKTCEDHANKLQVYAESIKAKHEQDKKLLEESLDKKYTALLEESVQAIDENHTEKMQKIVSLLKEDKEKAVKLALESQDADYAAKLENVHTIYESKLSDAKAELTAEKEIKVSLLAEGVEKYLNYALEENMPKKELISEAKYKSAIKTLDKVVDLLAVNKIIQESADGIFADYEKQLADAKSTQNKLISEKIELKSQLNKKEAQLLLEHKVQKCTPGEARFLKEYFKNASAPSVIEESIDAAHTAWKKIQSEQRAKLQESTKKDVSKQPSAVVVESVKQDTKESETKKQVISEQAVQKPVVDNTIEFYAKVLSSKQ